MLIFIALFPFAFSLSNYGTVTHACARMRRSPISLFLARFITSPCCSLLIHGISLANAHLYYLWGDLLFQNRIEDIAGDKCSYTWGTCECQVIQWYECESFKFRIATCSFFTENNPAIMTWWLWPIKNLKTNFFKSEI